ncbi:MAG TPA: TonB family protein [Thermodesulfovibrionales bacterium]|nr:TonB family protein [Thermodesulfovibrionales bacterium]
MSAASLQRSAAISFLLHLTLFGAALWAARHSNHFVMPSPYVVNLVSPASVTSTQGGAVSEVRTPEKPVSEKSASEKPAAHKSRPESMSAQERPKALRRNREEYLSERIAEIEAKEKIKKRVWLRDVVSLKAGKGGGGSVPSTAKGEGGSVTGTARQGRGSNIENYAARVGEEIRQHWAYPETGEQDIEAIISIRIQKNGSLQILGVEKSSGNPLFDRSALRAITKASPVTPPSQEMEIGVRFYP